MVVAIVLAIIAIVIALFVGGAIGGGKDINVKVDAPKVETPAAPSAQPNANIQLS
ncbi:hypothetical protein [Mesorhizobium sp. 131-2-1]|uniref:hypothetical protein n=1 Tax=Mesorhizobium sp. 131-2-1 TaxID=2744518 RepID=UPI001FD2AFD8|nr:hypothetical protein [Mesorhizobium sp. 131-2-1]